jgi:hypothetical protein
MKGGTTMRCRNPARNCSVHLSRRIEAPPSISPPPERVPDAPPYRDLKGRVAPWIRMASVFLFSSTFSPTTALAEGSYLRILTELEYRYTDIETESKRNDDESDSQISWFKQRYDVDAQKEIFPYLDVHAGGTFERIHQSGTIGLTRRDPISRLLETDTSHGDIEDETAWLFGEVNLNNPLYTASGAYRRREERIDDDDPYSTKRFREEYTGIWRWRPVGFPSIDLNYNHYHVWNDDDTRDTVNKFLTLENRYDYEGFSYDYIYTRNDTDQKHAGTETLNQDHNGRAFYSGQFLDDRLSLTAGLRLNYSRLEASGSDEVERRTSPPTTSFLQDDNDPTDPTSGTPYASPPPNIGQGAPSPVSFILKFDAETAVDTIDVIIGGGTATTSSIAAAAPGFSWRAFTRGSDDLENWVDISTLTPPSAVVAIYDPIDNLFELEFDPPLSTHQIKVQIGPPPPSLVGTILISRLDSFTTISFTTTEDRPGLVLKDFDQAYDLSLGWAFSDRTTTTYNAIFRMLETEPFDERRTRLTNSVDLRHFFNPVFYGSARVIRTDTTKTDREDTVQHSYSASLRADYLDTLSQSLVYSGLHDKAEDDTTLSNSIFLRTNADLYSGWSANLDLGYSTTDRREGNSETAVTFRVSTNVIPNPRANFTLDYQGSWRTETGEPSRLDQNARAQGFWVPFPTLSLFAAVSLRDRPGETQRLTIAQDYSVNWAPFQDGLLDFSLAYNQSIRSRDRETRTLSPEINWRITRTTLLTFRFNYSTLETESARQDVKSIHAWLRAVY